jgi:hypothetical protein
VRDHCSFSRSELRTLSRDVACPPCLRKSRRASLPCAALVRLTAHVDLAGKMLLTDFCNRPSIRALVVRPTPELLAYAMMDRVDDELQSVSPSAISMCGVQTALRQSEPQVDQRLTTFLQLRTVRPHLDLVIEVRDEPCLKAALSLRGVFSRTQIRRSDL